MYLEHFKLHTPPFREDVDPMVFFSGAGREKICQGLQGDLESGKLLVKLIGAEGAGKTLICKVLQDTVADGYEVVYLDNPVGSFDDLLRIICVDLGASALDTQADLMKELKEQLLLRQQTGQKVLLILDEAEKIFLATLERLLRLLCELEESGNFSLMLAGRPALQSNIEQLTVYCTGVDVESGYSLEPMSREETGQYLVERLLAAGLDSAQKDEVFTEEAVDKLYAKAGGNPRMTSILAEEALQKSCTEKSFMVLLDHVDIEEGAGGHQGAGLLAGMVGKGKLIGGGAVLLILAVLAFFFMSGSHEPIEQAESLVAGGHQENSPGAAVSQGAPELEPVAEPGETPEPLEGTAQPGVQEPQEDESSMISVEAPGKKILPVEQKQAVSEQQEQKPADDLAGTRDGEQLFEERLRASAGWLAGAYRGEYTIQLMMLASEQASGNVQKILVQDEYYAIRDELHILRKKTTPPTLFVFYGTFASMDDARRARNQMPIFLRKHHPYALSIADALTKTED